MGASDQQAADPASSLSSASNSLHFRQDTSHLCASVSASVKWRCVRWGWIISKFWARTLWSFDYGIRNIWRTLPGSACLVAQWLCANSTPDERQPGLNQWYNGNSFRECFLCGLVTNAAEGKISILSCPEGGEMMSCPCKSYSIQRQSATWSFVHLKA